MFVTFINLNDIKRIQTNYLIEKIKLETIADDQKPYVKKLLQIFGPIKTQDIMYENSLASTPESHLLGHIVGEYIYKNYGEEGIVMCRDYFLSGCYHTFIISLITEKGLEGYTSTLSYCAKQGENVLEQCSHAGGHAFTAMLEYDLPKALSMCDQMYQNFPEAPVLNCYEGVFMENFRGVHGNDNDDKKWISQEDPFYPCSDARIEEKYLPACWLHQATNMHSFFEGDLKKVADECSKLTNEKYKEYCFNNYARQAYAEVFEDISVGESFCKFVPTEEYQYCIRTMAKAASSVGDYNFAFSMCDYSSGKERELCILQVNSVYEFYNAP